MQYRFFTVPIFDAGEAEAALNTFLNTERILHVDRHLIQDGRNSIWAVCVAYQSGAGPMAKDKRGKLDYRSILTEPEFAVFARMRSLRKELADKEGIPAYAIFTNEQLASIVQRRADTLQSMREIDGVGDARLEKYGAAFQELMQSAALPAPETGKREAIAG